MNHISYEHLMTEKQQLCKNLSSQKLAHEATLKQLQSSYSIIQSMQDTVRSLNGQLKNMRKELSQKTEKLSRLGSTYEQQILELKDAINIRDEQLATLRASFIVTDYDMIRLRVLNQVQITHKQETNSLEEQVRRLQNLLRNAMKQKQVDKSKIEYLKQQNLTIVTDYEIKFEQQQRISSRNINKLYEKLECEQRCRKQQERLLEKATKRYDELLKKYQLEFNKPENEYIPLNNKVTSGNQRHIEMAYHDLSNKTQQFEEYKAKTIRETKELKNKVSQLQKQLRDIMGTYISEQQHQRRIREKDEQIHNTTTDHDKRIRILRQEWEQQIRKVKKQHEKQIQKLRKANSNQKENERRQNSFDHVELSIHTLVTSLERRNKQLEDQVADLKARIEQLKKENQVTRKPMQKQTDVAMYRNKLKQANTQIVSLLKEKASLKEQIQRTRN